MAQCGCETASTSPEEGPYVCAECRESAAPVAVWCAWCRSLISGDGQSAAYDSADASHGICEDCAVGWQLGRQRKEGPCAT